MASNKGLRSALRAGISADVQSDDAESSDESSDETTVEGSCDEDISDSGALEDHVFEDLSNSFPVAHQNASADPQISIAADTNDNATFLLPATASRAKQMALMAAWQHARKRQAARNQPDSATLRLLNRNTEWTNSDFDPEVIPDITANLEIRKPIPTAPNVLDFLGLFFGLALVNHIVDQSNVYANYKQLKRRTKEGQ